MKKIFLTLALLLTVSFAFAGSKISHSTINKNHLESFVLKIKYIQLLNYKSLSSNNYSLNDEKQIAFIKINSIHPEPVCTVTCTAVMADGTVYTSTAGNWFSTCSGAETRCKAKLFDQIMGIQ